MTYFKKKIDAFRTWNDSMKALAQRNRERDRGFDRYAGRFSRFVWPVREAWLLAAVALLCLADFTSTYVALELAGNPHIVESGPLAGWALRTAGFPFLLLVDVFSAGTMAAIAFTARYAYLRAGLGGYARAAFVVLLLPYAVRTAIAVVNNVRLGSL